MNTETKERVERVADQEIRKLPLSGIKLDPLAQPRAVINKELVEEYRAAMEAGDVFPPLVVFSDRRIYRLADGYQRHDAATRAGISELACVVKEGGQREAILYACQANADHGSRRSNEDKRRAVMTLLLDEEWGQWSDREIAKHAKVGHPLVAAIRAEMAAAHLEEIPDAKRTVARRGKTYAMNTSRIGKGTKAVAPPNVAAGVPAPRAAAPTPEQTPDHEEQAAEFAEFGQQDGAAVRQRFVRDHSLAKGNRRKLRG